MEEVIQALQMIAQSDPQMFEQIAQEIMSVAEQAQGGGQEQGMPPEQGGGGMPPQGQGGGGEMPMMKKGGQIVKKVAAKRGMKINC